MELRKCFGPIHKGAEIDLSLFGLNQKACRVCKKAYNRSRYEAKRDKIILQNQTYRKTHPDMRKRGPGERKPYVIPMDKRVWLDLQRYVQRTLKGYPYLFDSLEALVGVSREAFFAYIQTQLTRGMNLGNYGHAKLKWEVQNNFTLISADFRTSEGQAAYFNFRNLKPAWFKSNKTKIPFPDGQGTSNTPREQRLREAA